MRRQPQRPVRAVGILQQRIGQAVGGLADRRARREQRGTRDRHQHRGDQALRQQAGIVPQAMTNGDIDPVPPEIDQPWRCLDTDFDIGIPAGETPQPRHEPGRGEGRHRADGDRLARTFGFQRPQGLLDLVERHQQGGMHARARLGRHHPVAAAHEQRHADTLFQLPDLLADRARRHAQRFGGALHAAMAPDFRESAQGKQGEHRIHGLDFLNPMSRSNRFDFLFFTGRIAWIPPT